MHFTGRHHGGDTAVHGGVDPADLVLARCPVAKHRVHMAVYQAGCHAGLAHIDGGFRALGVYIFEFAHCGDDAVHDDDGVGLQNGFVYIAGEQQSYVFNDDFARCFFGCCGGHDELLGTNV